MNVPVNPNWRTIALTLGEAAVLGDDGLQRAGLCDLFNLLKEEGAEARPFFLKEPDSLIAHLTTPPAAEPKIDAVPKVKDTPKPADKQENAETRECFECKKSKPLANFSAPDKPRGTWRTCTACYRQKNNPVPPPVEAASDKTESGKPPLVSSTGIVERMDSCEKEFLRLLGEGEKLTDELDRKLARQFNLTPDAVCRIGQDAIRKLPTLRNGGAA